MKTWLPAMRAGVGALRANPVRSALTTVGIVIGIAAVVVVLAVGEGARLYLQQRIQALGSNLVILKMESPVTAAGMTFVELDETQLVKAVGGVDAASPRLNMPVELRVRGKPIRSSVSGVTSSYFSVRNIELVAGRALTRFDVDQRRRVCILSLAAMSAAGLDVSLSIGMDVMVDGREYRVIGVATDVTDPEAANTAPEVFIPYSVAREEWPYVPTELAYLKLTPGGDQATIVADLRAYLSTRYGAFAGSWPKTMSDLVRNEKEIGEQARWAILGVAALALIVGGVGIMNVLLVSVRERIREIGTRKAIGADNAQIFVQFLSEGTLLCLLGGFAGMLLGISVSSALQYVLSVPVALSIGTVAWPAGVCWLLGMIFSAYPAMDAARLAPTDALRFE